MATTTTPEEGTPQDRTPEERAKDAARTAAWKRGAYMLFFLLLFGLAQSLQGLVALFQFVHLLATGAPNRPLAEFGRSFAVWLAEVSAFLTCATETVPFPWKRWPEAE